MGGPPSPRTRPLTAPLATAARTAPATTSVMTPVFASFVLALLMGLQPITTDLMLPALPALGSDLQAPMAAVQLTMSALILAFGLAQLVWGPVADRVGRRPVLLSALALYALASLGASLASHVAQVVGWRAAQGAAMSAVVVCGRAMVRDLYEPQQGAMVMARALTGLGLVAIASPVVGGALVTAWGWRAAVAAMGVAALAVGLLVAWRVPESARALRPDATRLGPLLRQAGAVLAHPSFRAWSLLVGCSYGGIFIFLASSGFVLIKVLGLGTGVAGAVMATTSVGYIGGTLLCRRWIPRLGLAGATLRASRFTMAAAVALAVLAITDARHVLAVMLPMWLFALGHGVNNPCGQTGSVAPFPQAAGLASALSGFVTAVVAFGIGLWLGHALDGSVRPFATGLLVCALGSLTVAWTLVRRLGEPLPPRTDRA